MARLRERYKTDVRKALQEEFNYANPMEIPRLTKIVLNMGIGEGVNDKILGTFTTMGWEVVVLKYGRLQQAAFAEPGGADRERRDRPAEPRGRAQGSHHGAVVRLYATVHAVDQGPRVHQPELSLTARLGTCAMRGG